MDGEKVKLEWNNYRHLANNAFEALYYDEDLTDVTLACEGGNKLYAHKIVLSVCSDLFKKILHENKNPHPLIYLQGVGMEQLKLLKKFIYLGQSEVDKSNLVEFHRFAKTVLDLEVTAKKQKRTIVAGGREVEETKADQSSFKYLDMPSSKNEPDKNKSPEISLEDKIKLDLDKGESVKDIFIPVVKICDLGKPSDRNNVGSELQTLPKTKMSKKYLGHFERTDRKNMYPRLNCNKCSYVCTSMQKMKNHIKSEHLKSKEKINKVPCQVCGKIMRNDKNGIEEHMRRAHGDKSIQFNCQQCSYSTTYEKNLKTHINRSHDKSFLCDKCPYKTGDKALLRSHTDNVHDIEKHLCDKCDFITTSKDRLKFHEEKEHLGIRYKCNLCDYKATSLQNLKPHMLSVHEKLRIICSFCTYSDSLKSRVILHESREHGPKDPTRKEEPVAREDN